MPDNELRNQIMRALNGYYYEQYERWEMLSLFEQKFADRLRKERCRPPQPSKAYSLIGAPVVLLGIVYWFLGAPDALVVGVVLLLPVLVFSAVGYIAELYQHDVTLREAIKLVDQRAAASEKEAQRRLHLPNIFSVREVRTGEMDDQDENRHGN